MLNEKAKNESGQLDRKIVDSFFIHQCVVRRFKFNYRNSYVELLQFRAEVESVLCRIGLVPIPNRINEISSVELAAALMNFLGKKNNRSTLSIESIEDMKDIFYGYINEYPFANFGPLSGPPCPEYLNDEHLFEIISILKKNLNFCTELIEAYTFFDYYSLFSMTVDVDFECFFKFYLMSRDPKKVKSHFWSDELRDRGVRWLTLGNSELHKLQNNIDSNIYISIKTKCFVPYFYSSNINVITDEANEVIINGEKSENSIFLQVAVNQIPINIDAAVQYFKHALLELLYYNNDTPEARYEIFKNSDFVTSYEKKVFLIKQWNCINSIILGLWCWDLMKCKKYSKVDAVDKILKNLSKNLNYTEASTSSYYDRIAKVIAINVKNKNSLDRFITGSETIILGVRNQ